MKDMHIYFIHSCTAPKTATMHTQQYSVYRTRCRCGLLYLKVPYLLQQKLLCIPRTAGWLEVTSKYERTFCHQTAKAKSHFCDHEAATLLFIEIADKHIAISYVRGRWRPYLQTGRASETWTEPLRTLCLFAVNATTMVAKCKNSPCSR